MKHMNPVQSPVMPNPEANSRNVITAGRARFTLLTERMLRLEWADDGRFEDRATLVVANRTLPTVRRTVQRLGNGLTVRTSGFVLEYRDNRQPFSKATLGVRFRLNGKTVR